MGLPAAQYAAALRRCRSRIGGRHVRLKRHLAAGKRYRDGLLAECARFGLHESTQSYLLQVRCHFQGQHFVKANTLYRR